MRYCFSIRANIKPATTAWLRLDLWLAAVLSCCLLSTCSAQSPGNSSADVAEASESFDDEEHAQRCDRLEQQLTGSVFIGHFTDAPAKPRGDAEQPPLSLKEERYEIKSAKRMPGGQMWLIQARIKYGDKDITVPIPLPIKWAGTTPVISLDQLTIPGMGTFDAKVVIAGDRYAGTWQHGEHGGHLFGRIESATPVGSAGDTDH